MSISPAQLQAIKLRVIDATFERFGVKSVADLGGVWAVDGGYTFYVLEKWWPKRAFLVDEYPTEAVARRAADHPSLTLIRGDFASRETVRAIGPIDAVLLFDVLLHQVAPDWNEILEMYSEIANVFVIVNPMYVRSARTIRLLDLGRDEYLETVPDLAKHHEAFERMDDVVPGSDRPYRTSRDIWQWGIVEEDLRETMATLGYSVAYFENAGQWRDLPAFENHAFVFWRDQGSPAAA